MVRGAGRAMMLVVLLSLLWAAVSASPASNLILANGAMSVRFDGTTGELVSMINHLGITDDEYLTNLTHSFDRGDSKKQQRQQQPFCAQGENGHFYIKTGGNPSVKSGWKGPPIDRCCRVKDATGKNCFWYTNHAACQAALPKWRTTCLSCAAVNTPLGCPIFSGPPSSEQLDGHGLFLAWVDTTVPTIAKSAGWAGGTPSPSVGLPGTIQQAIGPRQCNLTSHAMTVDADTGDKTLSMTFAHRPTSLRFHFVATLAGGGQTKDNHIIGALNMSLNVELPSRRSTMLQPLSPGNITVAFPYITGIAIGTNGSTNAGINHFGTGLATDGTLRAWVPSGGLYGWQ